MQDVLTDEQFDNLLSALRDGLSEEVQAIEADGYDGYPSELAVLCEAWRRTNDWFHKNGFTDGYFAGYQHHGDYLPIESYEEGLARRYGQLIGEAIIALDPSQWASAHPEKPFFDVTARYNEIDNNDFIYEPIPKLDHWTPIEPADIHYTPPTGVLADCARCDIGNGLWAELWSMEFLDDSDGDRAWCAQLCSKDRVHEELNSMTAPRWFLCDYMIRGFGSTYFDSEPVTDEYAKGCDTEYALFTISPRNDAHQAWATLNDVWQGSAYRFL